MKFGIAVLRFDFVNIHLVACSVLLLADNLQGIRRGSRDDCTAKLDLQRDQRTYSACGFWYKGWTYTDAVPSRVTRCLRVDEDVGAN